MLFLIITLNCQCESISYIRALKNADIAFEGIVTKIDTNFITFKVINPIKGVMDSTMEILDDRMCLFNFSENRVYRVFARKVDDKFITNKCMGNSQIDSDEDIRDYSE